MIIWRVILLFCAMRLASQAAEVFAWKVPLANYSGDGLKDKSISKCSSAPEFSVFFHEGDELWDLSDARTNGEKIPLDWLIWNATTRRIVAKGSWKSMTLLHDRLGISAVPRQVRTTVELFETPADLSALGGSHAAASVSVVSRSGQKFEASDGAIDQRAGIEGEATISDGPELSVDLRFSVSGVLRGQKEFAVTCGVVLENDVPLWVARDYDGKKGIDVRITCSAIAADGTPLAEVLLRQKEGKEERLRFGREIVEPMAIGGGFFMSQGFGPVILEQILNPAKALQTDPFAPSASPFEAPSQSLLIPLPEIQPPPALRQYLDHPLLDLRDFFKQAEVRVDDGDFVGYDPFSGRIYVFARNSDVVDNCIVLFGFRCGVNRMVALTLSGDGEKRIVGNSGQKADLSRSEGGQVVGSWMIEPVIGENSALIDLRMEYTDAGKVRRVAKTAVTLETGVFLEMSGNRADGGGPLRIEAEVIDFSAGHE